MKITTPMLLALVVGSLLLWSGLTDRNPAAVLKAILSGKPIPEKGSGKPK